MSEVENTCRACFQKSKSLLKFEEKLTKSENIFECFQNLTSIMIKSNEIIQSKICRKCFKKLKEACAFKEECLKNDDKFRDLLGSIQISEAPSKQKLPFIEPFQMVVVKDEPDFESGPEPNLFDSDDEEQSAIKIKEEEIETAVSTKKEEPKPKVQKKKRRKRNNSYDFGRKPNIKCQYCGKKYLKSAIRTHQRRSHLQTFYCDLCPTKFKRKETMLKHILELHSQVEPKFECTYCPRKFLFVRFLNVHLKTHLTENEFGDLVEKKPKPKQTEFKCNYCDKVFEGNGAKSRCCLHEKKVHDNGRLTEDMKLEARKKKMAITHATDCPSCFASFDTWMQRYRHEVRHHRKKGEKHTDYICDLCGAARHQKKNLLSHLKKHLGIMDQICDFCGKAFVYSQSLQAHRLTAHKTFIKKYECDTCGVKFRVKHQLADHVKIHSARKDFQCTSCGKRFTRKCNLQIHMDTHSTTFDHKCSMCPKKFSNKRSLNSHVRQHKNDANGIVFQCPQCPTQTKRKHLLQQHMRKHGTRDHVCPYCPKAFFEKFNVTQHVLSMHLNASLGCKLCGFQIKIKKFFQTKYIKHVRQFHHELTPQEMDLFEFEIKKLRYKDVCPDLPASLKGASESICNICNEKFINAFVLRMHQENVHGLLKKKSD